MKRLPKKIEYIDPVAQTIWHTVVDTMDQYTNDSVLSKFYLPEELVTHCRSTASIFAQVHYAPLLEPDEAYKTRLYTLFLFSMMCVVQIYLKERSMIKNYPYYKIVSNERLVKEARQKVTKLLFDGAVILETIDQVINMFLAQLMVIRQKRRFTIKDKIFDEEKFDRFLPASILWGYLFTKELIID